MKFITHLCLATSILLFPATSLAIESFRLSDVIKSNGSGSINLFKDITPQQLEQLRLDNSGELVLGVDVNEAANGTEKATTQGVTVESIQLLVNINNTIYEYTDFYTQSKTLVAKDRETTRNEYYTLLGETGSNRISSSNQVQNAFDSTLNIPVTDDLSTASSAVIHITLLDTNTSLGDPEAFYDYSNGYEDVAILNATDAAYLNDLRAGYEEAPVVISDAPEQDPSQTVTSWVYYPASGENYIVAYEDLFPATGDYDFNDLSVAYHVEYGFNNDNQVIRISGEAYLITRGAAYNHDWYLRIALPGAASGVVTTQYHEYYQVNGNVTETSFTGDLVLQGFSNTLYNFTDPDKSMVNTFRNSNFIKGPRFTFNVTLDAPLDLASIAQPPYDPYLYVHDTGYEIHLMDQAASAGSKNTLENQLSFQDENGFPFAMILPHNWKPPYAGVNIKSAYPDFAEFIKSKGSNKKTWFSLPSNESVFSVMPGEWQW